MSIKGGMVAHLKADAGVAAIVGTKVYPVPIPQGQSAPYLLYQRYDTDHIRDLSGPSGLRRTSFQLDAYSESPAEAEALSESVRLSLDGWRGTWSGIRVTSVILEKITDAFINDPDGGEDVLYRVSIDIIVWHAESIPDTE